MRENLIKTLPNISKNGQKFNHNDWMSMPNVPVDNQHDIQGKEPRQEHAKNAGREMNHPESSSKKQRINPEKRNQLDKMPKSEKDSKNVNKGTTHKNKTPPWTKTESGSPQEICGRKLQSLEVEDLGMDEVDYSGTITADPNLGQDPTADTRSVWSEISYYMVKDFRYYFQHPYFRIFIAYFVVFCNFLIFAEDPVAHSRKKCNIPVVGNCYVFIIELYPPNTWSIAKIALWILAIFTGMIIGKLVIHRFLFGRFMRLRMFRNDQGSWMVMFLSVIVLLFLFSILLNILYLAGGDALLPYKVTGLMGIENQTFMKAAACGTWMGDFVTAWMVTDMMLQDKLYPNWAKRLRSFWQRGYNRIILFWVVWFSMTLIVVLVITTDWVNWDDINNDFLVSNEVSRAYLASMILVFDLLIVMQDWDFPHFESAIDIKLPGLNTAGIDIKLPACLRRDSWDVHITGKWFNYGIIFLVMILDLNMWKNQIFYLPYDFGQYVDNSDKVWTVTDSDSLTFHNDTILTYEWRRTNTNPLTNRTYATDDFSTNSRFYDYALAIKATAFVPSIAGFITFGLLIWWYGRYALNPNDPNKGRLFKRKKMKRKNEQVMLTNVKRLDAIDRGLVNAADIQKESGV